MKPLNHGTRSAYSYSGCRCELCKEANRTYSRERPRRRIRIEPAGCKRVRTLSGEVLVRAGRDWAAA